MINMICLFILVLLFSNTKQFDLGNKENSSTIIRFFCFKETCRSPLGIETGKIFDSAFSSSSHAGTNSTASKARFGTDNLYSYIFLFCIHLRIRSETNGWCPLTKISKTTYEYLQIDLVNITVITLIELQGKFSQQPVGSSC